MTEQGVMDIGKIRFGVLSPQDIRDMAVCKVDVSKMNSGSGTIYDKLMGPVADTNEECKLCGLKKECMGHFGYTELPEPVFQPIFIKYILSFLRCFCIKCYRLLVSKEQLELENLLKIKKDRRFAKILKKLEKMDSCSHCGNLHPKFILKDSVFTMELKQKGASEKISAVLNIYDIKNIFDNISDEDCVLIGLEPELIHPRNLVFTCIPVLPPCSRPYVMAGNSQICDDDITHQLAEILKICNFITNFDTTEKVGKEKALAVQKLEKLYHTLVFKVYTMIDNKQRKAKHPTDNRPIRCLTQRLGSKTGRLRENAMGKRVDFSARTVIGAGPTLKLAEIGVPEEIAKIHTRPIYVTSYNQKEMQETVDKGNANFLIKKRADGTRIRHNLRYASKKRGTSLLYGDIIIRGLFVPILEDKFGNAVLPKEALLELEKIHKKEERTLEKGCAVFRKGILHHIKNTQLYALEKGDKIIPNFKDKDITIQQKEICVKNKSNFNVLYYTNKNLVEKFSDFSATSSHVEKFSDFSATKSHELEDGDRIIRNGKLIQTVYPVTRHIKVEIGDIVERQLRNGDIVLYNRQPTLHKGSMLGMRVNTTKYKTFNHNLAACPTFNADFDGDEMNMHAPQSDEAIMELLTLSMADKNIISAQESIPKIVIVQDSLVGAYLMTRRNFELTEIQFRRICEKCERVDGSSLWNAEKIQTIKDVSGTENVYNGKGLISMILPDTLYYENQNDANLAEPVVKIYKGVYLEGTINKKIVGSAHGSLIQILNKEYGYKVVANFIDNMQFITNDWLLVYGFSIGLEDCMIDPEKVVSIQDSLVQNYTEAQAIEESTFNPGIMEIRIRAALSRAREIGMKIAKEAIPEYNNFLTTVGSGAKGDYFNICQILALMGQQNLEGCRVPAMLNNNTRTLPHYPFENLSREREYQSRGFISSSFAKGLSPEEFMFHAMSGREGVCDTAMGTSQSGYMQRRIIKALEDLHVEYDLTVRDQTEHIYQFSYGETGWDVAQTVKVDGANTPCNIKRLMETLNHMYEEGQIDLASAEDKNSSKEFETKDLENNLTDEEAEISSESEEDFESEEKEEKEEKDEENEEELDMNNFDEYFEESEEDYDEGELLDDVWDA